MDKGLFKYIPEDDIYLFNTGKARKAWLCYGCVYIPDLSMHRFIVYAPNARAVSVLGDFNSWCRDSHPMERFRGDIFVSFIPGLKDGDLYKYCITEPSGAQTLRADPFAAFGQCGEDTASIIWTGEPFPWTDAGFLSERARRSFMSSPMSIYELHAGSWRDFCPGRPIYRELAESLSEYCREMGYTHVELMPITEYPFDGSWGYQVSGYYAPTSRYGTPDDFKYFVDTLHSAGIGVIIDWVPAHFPRDRHALAMFDGTPLFECSDERMASHPEWGTLIFDYASPQVRSFLISSACKFFEVFHIDGIRVDAVTSMLYLSYGRNPGEYTPNREGGDINLDAVSFLRELNYAVLTGYPGAVTVAEESTAYPLVTAPPDSGGLGFCLKWDMGFMHDTLDYMQLDSYFRSFNHNKMTFSMMYAFSENYVLAYSHDEVVHGKCSMINKMYGDYDTKFSDLKALYGFQFGHPGKKLTFMGSEFGQFIEWDPSKQLDWFLLEYPKHDSLRRYSRDLNSLYRRYPALYRVDRSWDGFKWLNVNDSSRSSLAFLRSSVQDNSYVVCVFNFTPVRYDGFIIGLPCTGNLRPILNSDDEIYGGSGVHNHALIRSGHEAFLDLPCSAALTLPPNSAQFFEFHPRKNARHE